MDVPITLGVAALFVAVILLAQGTDPQQEQSQAQRQALLGESWRARRVVSHVPADLANPDAQAADPLIPAGDDTPLAAIPASEAGPAEGSTAPGPSSSRAGA